MKREDELKQGKYEWEMDYKTNYKPLNKFEIFLLKGFGFIVKRVLRIFAIVAIVVVVKNLIGTG